MKNSFKNLLKQDLETIPLVAYFVFYFLYLFFDKIVEQKDYAILVKPVIIPIIAFLYLTNKNSKKSVLSILLLVLIFISDNSILLELRTFHIYSTILYFFSLVILLFYALSDKKFFVKNKSNRNNLAISLIGLVVISLIYLVFNYNLNEKAAEKFIVYEYMFTFLILFLICFFNFIRYKSKKTKYLFLTILCLFLSDLCFSIQHYYNGHVAFNFLVFFVEIPVYYFLLRYLLKKDKESIVQ